MRTVNIPISQETKANHICLKCRGFGTMPTHRNGCRSGEVYPVPASGEVPRLNASERKWKDFLENYVYARPVGYWAYAAECWYYKHISKK